MGFKKQDVIEHLHKELLIAGFDHRIPNRGRRVQSAGEGRDIYEKDIKLNKGNGLEEVVVTFDITTEMLMVQITGDMSKKDESPLKDFLQPLQNVSSFAVHGGFAESTITETSTAEQVIKSEIDVCENIVSIFGSRNKLNIGSMNITVENIGVYVEARTTLPQQAIDYAKDILEDNLEGNEVVVRAKEVPSAVVVKRLIQLLQRAGLTGGFHVVEQSNGTNIGEKTASIAVGMLKKNAYTDLDEDPHSLDAKTFKQFIPDLKKAGFYSSDSMGGISTEYELRVAKWVNSSTQSKILSCVIQVSLKFSKGLHYISTNVDTKGDLWSCEEGSQLATIFRKYGNINTVKKLQAFVSDINDWSSKYVAKVFQTKTSNNTRAIANQEVPDNSLTPTQQPTSSTPVSGNIDMKAEVEPDYSKCSEDQKEELKRIYAYAKKFLPIVNDNPEMNFIYLDDPSELDTYKMPTVGLMLYTYDINRSNDSLNKDEVYLKFNWCRAMKKYKLWHKTTLKGKPIKACIFIDKVYARENSIRGLKKEYLYVDFQGKSYLCESYKGKYYLLKGAEKYRVLEEDLTVNTKLDLVKDNVQVVYKYQKYRVTAINGSRVILKNESKLISVAPDEIYVCK